MGCVDSRVCCPSLGGGSSSSRAEDYLARSTTRSTGRFDAGRRTRRPQRRPVGDLEEISRDIQEPDPKDEETLRVTDVDFLVEQNVKEHHTEEYDITDRDLKLNPMGRKLVIRRGQPFDIRINLSRPYNPKVDHLHLVFQTGDNPTRRNGTLVKCVLSDQDLSRDWGARVVQQNDKSIDVKVLTPPECIVGKWHFKVDVAAEKDGDVKHFRYSYKDPIYLLFNPWCEEDAVYLNGQAECEEYVLNESGVIWIANMFFAKPWYFGQFSGSILDCCMYLLEKCRLKENERGNPVKVVRQLSAMVNSPDDYGVLSGNWSGDYSGGKSPMTWTGSKAILEEYYKLKRPVKYGQCWVFSGVLTAVLRALGIPARSVTNFSSAHDVNASITIDTIIDDQGDTVELDSVWNYHVWNEAWMTRPELAPGYGGWQVCDATPQEKSDDVFCCGPCPVRAIKEGEVNLAYDGPFIFAEVNADRVTWLKKPDGSLQKLRVDKTTIGKDISTKSLQSDNREDLTSYYKHPEGTPAERIALHRAQQLSNSTMDSHLEEKTPEDVNIKLHFDRENTFVGDDFTLKMQGYNESSEPRTVEGIIVVKTMYYTGIEADLVARIPFQNVQLEPQKGGELEFRVTEEEYRSKLKDMCLLSIRLMATVKETGQIFTDTEQACLRKPHLQIQGPTSALLGEEFEVQLSFTNPLSTKLTHCYVELESHGITGDKKKYGLRNVHPKQTFTHSLKLKSTKRGQREVVVIFNSKELEDINGAHRIHITN